jgi:Mn-dependent DtxR family transcriptional regulator
MGSSISHINIVSLPAFETLDEKIYELIEKNGNMSVNEISKMLNAKPSSVKSALVRLKRKGLVSATKEAMQKGARR